MQRDYLPFPRGSTFNTVSPTMANQEGEWLGHALIGESERGQILIATAFVENSLEKYLRAKFDLEEVTKKQQKQLLDNTKGLLGSFWARSISCRVFGMIDDGECGALRRSAYDPQRFCAF